MLFLINAKSDYTPYKYYKNIEVSTGEDPITNCANFFNEIFRVINQTRVSNKTKKKHIKELNSKTGKNAMLKYLAYKYKITDYETWITQILNNRDFNTIVNEYYMEYKHIHNGDIDIY